MYMSVRLGWWLFVWVLGSCKWKGQGPERTCTCTASQLQLQLCTPALEILCFCYGLDSQRLQQCFETLQALSGFVSHGWVRGLQV
jgi:hypothetical protein